MINDQPSRDYHNEIRAERDKLRVEVEQLTRERDVAIREWIAAVKAHGLCETRADAEQKLALAREFVVWATRGPIERDVLRAQTALSRIDELTGDENE